MQNTYFLTRIMYATNQRAECDVKPTFDRTNWKEGQEHINILMLAIVYPK